jgi:hypothetical protein
MQETGRFPLGEACNPNTVAVSAEIGSARVERHPPLGS